MRAANDIRVGDRVIRGPTWEWGDQGGDTVGIVVHYGYSWVKVRWGTGRSFGYRVKGSNSCGPTPKDGWQDVIRVDTKFDRIEQRMDKNMDALNKIFKGAGV